MQLIFLGTSSMMPTKDRNQTGILLSYKNENILLDCGEGIQRQMKMAGVPLTKLTKILISHWHGDHSLGIVGLLQSIAMSEYDRTLRLFGPPGTIQNMEKLAEVYGAFKVGMEIHEIKEGVIHECEDFFIEALPLHHSVPVFGFRFVEKDRRKVNMGYLKKLGMGGGPLVGKIQYGEKVVWKGKEVDIMKATALISGRKVAYIADTAPCPQCTVLAQDADVLISEASFGDELEDKAEEYMHMTAKQAALIASRANAKKLYLLHLSQRYKDPKVLEEQASAVFSNTICAKDFMKVKI